MVTRSLRKMRKQAPKALRASISSHLGLLPDFIIVGAMKCGTTSLYKYLAQHPNIIPAATKEVGYFDRYYERGMAWYRSHFPPGVYRRYARSRGRDFITGEASTGYIAHPGALTRIKAAVPDARLILILRDPIDRAYSHYQHSRRMGVEPLTFEEALRAEGDRLAGFRERIRRDEGYFSLDLAHYGYLSLGEYAGQVKTLLTLFPREQVLVLSCESLERNPSSVMATTLDFLGVPAWQPPQYDRHNSGSYEPMSADVRRWLADYFRPHNERLCEFLGVDFGWDKRAGAM